MIARAGISLVVVLVLAGCVGPVAVAPRAAPMALGVTPQNAPLMRYALWVDYLIEPSGELPQQARSDT